MIINVCGFLQFVLHAVLVLSLDLKSLKSNNVALDIDLLYPIYPDSNLWKYNGIIKAIENL